MNLNFAGDTAVLLAARLLRVRRKELPRTVMIASLAVVLGWGMSNGVNVTQAVLLTRAGVASLPEFFIYLALTVWPTLLLRGFITARIGAGRTLAQILLLNGALAVLLFLAYLEGETPIVSIVAAVACSVCFEVVLLLFWEFVSDHFNLLEGKRIFPVIAAGISLGYILSGVTVAVVARYWPPERLMLSWALGAGLAALVVFKLDTYLETHGAEHQEAEAAAAPAPRSTGVWVWLHAIGHLFTNRLVFAMVMSAALLLSVLRISDYLVAVEFVRATGGDLDELAVLLGNTWSVSYALQLTLGLIVTPYLLTKAGVKNTILTLPAAALTGFALLAVAPGLLGGVGLFVVRNAIATGIDDPAQNVLSGALPEKLKAPLKRLVDAFVLPGSAVTAGVILLVTHQHGEAASARQLALGAIGGSLLLVISTLWVRSLYIQAIYHRLRSHNISVGDLHQALGDLSREQFQELKRYVQEGDPNIRCFAAAAIGRLAPDRFAEMVADLAASPDPGLRKLAFQLAPTGSLTPDLLARASRDDDPWVAAAAAVAGFSMTPTWEGSAPLLGRLLAAPSDEAVAAGVWASATLGEATAVVTALAHARPRVRLEALRRFARLQIDPAKTADSLLACIRGADVTVRREALHQVMRWPCPPARLDDLSVALTEAMSSSDGVTRRLAAEALAAHHPNALDGAVHLLHGHNEIAVATVESFIRSGRRHLVQTAEAHLAELLHEGVKGAREAAKFRRLARATAAEGEEPQLAILRVAHENFQAHVVEMCMAALRALHRKRGFETIEAGLRSHDPAARAEALETLLNLGPAWLVEPLVSLLEADSFETSTLLVSPGEVHDIERRPEEWLGAAATTTHVAAGENMRNLAALRSVPIFAALSLDDLAGIDRMMVTRHYRPGDVIFRRGEHASELFVIRDGEVRLYRDAPARKETVALVGAGEFVGEAALLPDDRRTLSAQAQTECTVRVLRGDRLEAVMHRHPEILLGFVRHIAARSRAATA